MSKWKDKTRGGHPVRIYAEDGKGPYPIHGAINEGDGWKIRMWSTDGTLWHSDISADSDLVASGPIIDWSKQPDWCKAVAMDYDSVWHRFVGKPYLVGGIWYNCDCFRQQIHPSEYPAFDGDWKDSLCIRPEGGAK